ncbi:TIR domain-containing protein [Actinokineospora sp. 24-640]
MKRETYFPGAQFPVEVIDAAISVLSRFRLLDTVKDKEPVRFSSMVVAHGHSIWTHDDIDAWMDDYRRQPLSATLTVVLPPYQEYSTLREAVTLELRFSSDVAGPAGTSVAVEANSTDKIESVMNLFAATTGVPSPLPAANAIALRSPAVFIGHGRSDLWRDLKDHLLHQHGLTVQAYETGARAGHGIRDILESLLSDAAFAILVLTGDDTTEAGTKRARQNVVHEVGLFQGRLGWHRAVLVVEEDVELFSNIDGVQQIGFSRGNIRETFGDVVSTLHREFGRSVGRP